MITTFVTENSKGNLSIGTEKSIYTKADTIPGLTWCLFDNCEEITEKNVAALRK